MKKELIVIVAFCPDQKRKTSLYYLLSDLQNFREKYDILLTSHTNFDTFFTELVDYFYFDKENIVLTDLEYQQNGWYSTNGKDIIWSSFINMGNYLPSIYKILIPGLSIAKSLGYEKIHKLEYDSRISSILEFEENSELLNEYDYVIYRNPSTNFMSGNFMSFNLEKIIDLWKTFDLKKIKYFISTKYPKASEFIVGNEIKSNRTFFEKNLSDLIHQGIDSGKIISNKTNWSYPFFDYENHKLRFLNANSLTEPFLSEVIVNNKTYLNFGLISQNSWQINEIGDFKEIQNLTILKNKNVFLHIELSDNTYRKEFIKRNFLEKI